MSFAIAAFAVLCVFVWRDEHARMLLVAALPGVLMWAMEWIKILANASNMSPVEALVYVSDVWQVECGHAALLVLYLLLFELFCCFCSEEANAVRRLYACLWMEYSTFVYIIWSREN